MPIRLQAGVAGTAVAALLLTACGGSADKGGTDVFAHQSVDDIIAAAQEDMAGVTALRMNANIEQEGTPTSMKVSMDKEGDCLGTIKQGKGAANFIVVAGAKAFMKADANFLAATGAEPNVSEMMAGKWVDQGPPKGLDICNLQGFLDEFTGEQGRQSATKGALGKVGGKGAIEVISKEGRETTRVWIATEGDHHILKMAVTGGDEPGDFMLSKYNQDVKAVAPKDALDMTKQP